jgi:transposase
MSRRKISNELWEMLEPLIPEFVPLAKGGRRRSVDDRAALNGIQYVLHIGVPWEDLPQELGCGGGMTCWRRLRNWHSAGVSERPPSRDVESPSHARPDRLVSSEH